MGEGEPEALGDELLDVGALDIVALLQLGDAENLKTTVSVNTTFVLGNKDRKRG